MNSFVSSPAIPYHMSLPRPRVDLVYFNAGAGHRSATLALEAVLKQQQRPWDIRLVNLNDVMAPTDMFKRITGAGLEDIYNLLLKKGWTLGTRQALPIMHGLIRLYHSPQVGLIEKFWRQDTPDLAVSLIPNFNRAMLQALRRITPRTPFVTILTDMADFPPHFWLEPQPQHVICGTAKAVEQARAMGHTPDRIHPVSGMILRPAFYELPQWDRAVELTKLGLDPSRPTGLALFGGQGAPVMADLVRRLQTASRPLQLILLCGHNDPLAARLRALPTRIPIHVEGFTTEVPRFMAISDFMIGKPGPGSISEAMAMKLPVIVERNAWTMPQERYNCDWLLERDAGIVLKNFRHIGPAIEQLLQPGTLDRMRANAGAIHNRAVFEIADILAGLIPA